MSTKRKIILCVLLFINIVCLVFVLLNYHELQTIERVLDSIEIK